MGRGRGENGGHKETTEKERPEVELARHESSVYERWSRKNKTRKIFINNPTTDHRHRHRCRPEPTASVRIKLTWRKDLSMPDIVIDI